jgi:hypothetical protein
MEPIVSFTTTSYRIQSIEPMVASIASGWQQPGRFIVYLGEDSFHRDQGIAEPPPFFRDYPLEIRFVKNIGPFKKLYYILSEMWENKDQIIVTVDDDVVYPPWFLRRLVEKSEKDTCCCYLAKQMKYNRDGTPAPYITYPGVHRSTVTENLIPIGAHGILYRPRMFTPRILRLNEYLVKASLTDDLWVTVNLRIAGTRIQVVDNVEDTFAPIPSQINLWPSNFSNNNDNTIKNFPEFALPII